MKITILKKTKFQFNQKLHSVKTNETNQKLLHSIVAVCVAIIKANKSCAISSCFLLIREIESGERMMAQNHEFQIFDEL